MPIRVRHIVAGYYALRSEPGVVAKLDGAGTRAFQATGGTAAGYAMDSRQGERRPQGRWRVSIAAVTPAAMLDNARHNTLLRAMSAARGG